MSPCESVSLVMTTFNRPAQINITLESIKAQNQPIEVVVVDDGDDPNTPIICKKFDVKYVKLNRPRTVLVRTPAYPNNVGIRAAKGDIIILQNAECRHMDPQTIEKLTGAVTDTNAVFARVLSVHANGRERMVYCGKESLRPYFFCGAIKKAWFEKLRGFDEDFTNSGFDDDDFGARLAFSGVTFDFTDVLVHHQWHPSGGKIVIEPMKRLFDQKCADMASGKITAVRNLDHEWGAL
jgi:glycosyltransferase involved in cell wall biosynthesis